MSWRVFEQCDRKNVLLCCDHCGREAEKRVGWGEFAVKLPDGWKIYYGYKVLCKQCGERHTALVTGQMIVEIGVSSDG